MHKVKIGMKDYLVKMSRMIVLICNMNGKHDACFTTLFSFVLLAIALQLILHYPPTTKFSDKVLHL